MLAFDPDPWASSIHPRLCVHVYSFFYVVPIAISGGGAVPFSGGQNFAAGPPPAGAGGTAA